MLMRCLVVCADGTWNDPSSNTNVYRLKNRLARRDQPCFYDPGVGTGRVREGRQTWLKNQLDRVGGGAFGAGVSGNIQEAYRWLVENYEEDDQLWFFGFSRGAFTVRSTVGFIRKVGLLRPPVDDRVLAQGYDLYRKADDTPDTPEAIAFRTRHNTRTIDQLNIQFVGVWDTVGALGVPGGLMGRISRKRWGFHDHRLSSHVKHAYQALATDELRAAYLAALWDSPFDAHQQVEQVWFAGNHSDVGGEAGEVALRWLGEKAEAAGLVFEPAVKDWPAPGNPRKRGSELTSRQWRMICGRAIRPIGDPAHAGQTLHATLDELYARAADYRPKNLVSYKNNTPMTAPDGRKWWYTLPGANEYYLGQYDVARRG
jgi:uncharacterized protein (DUF2235 family)